MGIFPGNSPALHPIFSILAFVAGGLPAIAPDRQVASPFRHFSAGLGAIALSNLLLYFVLGQSRPYAILGIGGLER
ncbi:MAG TPA: hypothetical protein HA349_10975 [Methanotrichaceae archaeon]|nr:hypothetical protein [Methanotrichaceae archaeon]